MRLTATQRSDWRFVQIAESCPSRSAKEPQNLQAKNDYSHSEELTSFVDESLIFEKTTKGQDEVATRAHRLPARERAVLILVDGKTPVRAILNALQHLPQAESYLTDLVTGGFIVAVASAPPAAGSSGGTAKAPTSSPAPPPVSLGSAKQFASHFLLDELGPDAEAVALRIEACRNLEEIRPTLEKAGELLHGVRGSAKAEIFRQGVSERLPKA